jgi:hypothetical protein
MAWLTPSHNVNDRNSPNGPDIFYRIMFPMKRTRQRSHLPTEFAEPIRPGPFGSKLWQYRQSDYRNLDLHPRTGDRDHATGWDGDHAHWWSNACVKTQLCVRHAKNLPLKKRMAAGKFQCSRPAVAGCARRSGSPLLLARWSSTCRYGGHNAVVLWDQFDAVCPPVTTGWYNPSKYGLPTRKAHRHA